MQDGPVLLDVESYPVAPEGLDLRLEQVHVCVRHGALSSCLRQVASSLIMFNSRRTYAGQSAHVGSSSIHISRLADVQHCKKLHETVAGHGPTTDDGVWYRKVVENRHGKTAEGLWYVDLRVVTRDAHVSMWYMTQSLLGELADIGKKIRGFFATPSCLAYAYENSPHHIPLGRHCEASI
jgi:hypothetical protein